MSFREDPYKLTRRIDLHLLTHHLLFEYQVTVVRCDRITEGKVRLSSLTYVHIIVLLELGMKKDRECLVNR